MSSAIRATLPASSYASSSNALSATKTSLKTTRDEKFSKWYREVIKEADLSDYSVVSGCMVIRPWGMGIWNQIQRQMDDLFKAEDCCEEWKFPLFIPLDLMAREATHVAGFAPECAIVTHHRLITNPDGKGGMIPDPESKLIEPLIVRPTSEIIIGETFRTEVRSISDLPMKVNQWVNVVRWENNTKPFLRTKEFFWQEGHCVFANEAEAMDNAVKMADLYRRFMTDVCAIPVICGEKSPGERFAGAEQTFCLEAMMQDGKAVQAGTSHYLGQNFAKSSEIKFKDTDNEFKYAHTTSWGVSTRLIGALIMTHGDDDGLRLPPRLAMHQVVVFEAGLPSEEGRNHISKIKSLLAKKYFFGTQQVSLKVDERKDLNAGAKGWEWVRKGIPIRIEIGKREAKTDTVTLYRRDEASTKKTVVKVDELVKHVIETLEDIQKNYLRQAMAFRDQHIRRDIRTLEEIKMFFNDRNNIGFVRAKWCGDRDTEEMLKKDFGVTIRCIPSDQSNSVGTCVLTGKPATMEAIFGRSY